MQTTINLTFDQRMIIILGLQARITQLEKRIENYQWYIDNMSEETERVEGLKQKLPKNQKELAETLALLKEMEF